jgi:hypothetical protein
MPGAANLNPKGRGRGNGIEAIREQYIGRLEEFFEVLIDLTKLYLQALQRASQRAHAVPGEPVVEGKANGNAPP